MLRQYSCPCGEPHQEKAQLKKLRSAHPVMIRVLILPVNLPSCLCLFAFSINCDAQGYFRLSLFIICCRIVYCKTPTKTHILESGGEFRLLSCLPIGR